MLLCNVETLQVFVIRKYLHWPFRLHPWWNGQPKLETRKKRCLLISVVVYCVIYWMRSESIWFMCLFLLFIIGSKPLTIKMIFRYSKYCCHSGPAHEWIVECWPLSSCFPTPILNLCLIWNTVLWKMYTWWHLGLAVPRNSGQGQSHGSHIK